MEEGVERVDNKPLPNTLKGGISLRTTLLSQVQPPAHRARRTERRRDAPYGGQDDVSSTSSSHSSPSSVSLSSDDPRPSSLDFERHGSADSGTLRYTPDAGTANTGMSMGNTYGGGLSGAASITEVSILDNYPSSKRDVKNTKYIYTNGESEQLGLGVGENGTSPFRDIGVGYTIGRNESISHENLQVASSKPMFGGVDAFQGDVSPGGERAMMPGSGSAHDHMPSFADGRHSIGIERGLERVKLGINLEEGTEVSKNRGEEEDEDSEGSKASSSNESSSDGEEVQYVVSRSRGALLSGDIPEYSYSNSQQADVLDFSSVSSTPLTQETSGGDSNFDYYFRDLADGVNGAGQGGTGSSSIDEESGTQNTTQSYVSQDTSVTESTQGTTQDSEHAGYMYQQGHNSPSSHLVMPIHPPFTSPPDVNNPAYAGTGIHGGGVYHSNQKSGDGDGSLSGSQGGLRSGGLGKGIRKGRRKSKSQTQTTDEWSDDDDVGYRKIAALDDDWGSTGGSSYYDSDGEGQETDDLGYFEYYYNYDNAEDRELIFSTLDGSSSESEGEYDSSSQTSGSLPIDPSSLSMSMPSGTNDPSSVSMPMPPSSVSVPIPSSGVSSAVEAAVMAQGLISPGVAPVQHRHHFSRRSSRAGSQASSRSNSPPSSVRSSVSLYNLSYSSGPSLLVAADDDRPRSRPSSTHERRGAESVERQRSRDASPAYPTVVEQRGGALLLSSDDTPSSRSRSDTPLHAIDENKAEGILPAAMSHHTGADVGKVSSHAVSEPQYDIYPAQDDRVEYESFQLKVIYEKNRTGFEETKDYPIRINSIIAGRYQILEYLGSAAFSRAVQCYDLVDGRYVCIKIIKNNKDFMDQSLDEIKILRYINKHADADDVCVVRLFDYFYHKEHLFIVCELLRDNLYEFSKYNRNSGGANYFTLARLQKITRQLLISLEYIHKLNLIHCDLKPENILIKSYSRCEVKTIDFGSSCFLTDHLSSYVQSRSYRAPEVILGLPYDQKIDIWSLGCILAELWTGQVLFQNNSVQTLLARIIGILGPFEKELLKKGRYTHKYFTKHFILYERPHARGDIMHIYPKRTSIKARLKCPDPRFIEFVAMSLRLRSEERPSARELMNHPFLHAKYDDPVVYQGVN